MSHPSWVRGLKQHFWVSENLNNLSHPSWVRGLKLSLRLLSSGVFLVAPLVGAWIETS